MTSLSCPTFNLYIKYVQESRVILMYVNIRTRFFFKKPDLSVTFAQHSQIHSAKQQQQINFGNTLICILFFRLCSPAGSCGQPHFFDCGQPYFLMLPVKLRVLTHLDLNHMQAFSDCLWRGFLMLMYYDLLAKKIFLNSTCDYFLLFKKVEAALPFREVFCAYIRQFLNDANRFY